MPGQEWKATISTSLNLNRSVLIGFVVSDAHVLSLTSFCLQYCAYALAIFYGAKLLLRGDLANAGEAFT